jgi:hypothetical protein
LHLQVLGFVPKGPPEDEKGDLSEDDHGQAFQQLAVDVESEKNDESAAPSKGDVSESEDESAQAKRAP